MPRPKPIWFGLREKAGATEFLGYETETAEGEVVALVKDGKEVAALKAGEEGAIVLNQTPFYGESGGQVGDTGIISADGVRFRVTDTQKKAGDVFAHFGMVEQGTLKPGDGARARRRSWAPQRHPAATIPPRTSCTRRCARCSAITWRRRARWSRPTGCGSTSRIPSR